MIPDTISRDDILRALGRFDEEYRGEDRYEGWEGDGRFRYALDHDGALYPPKQIIILAGQGDVDRNDFGGGPEANNFLRNRGFTVKPLPDGSGTSLRTRLQNILDGYVEARQGDPFGSSHPLWSEFEIVQEVLEGSAPVEDRPSLRVKWSVGQGNWTYLPWIALFDETETDTIQHGVYCVYLFQQDMEGVYLTLNQGVKKTIDEHGRREGRRLLAERAEDLRRFCDDLKATGFQLDDSIDLHSDHTRGIDYEHSTVAHKYYESGGLPDDSELLEDLDLVLNAYDIYLELEPTTDRAGEASESLSEPTLDLAAVCSDFASKLRDAGLRFGPDDESEKGQSHYAFVRDFVVSLATKQLVILTGLSGSGKTQIALQFGRWLSGTDGDRFRVVPVRPDWTGPEALFGYEDALQPALKDGRRAWNVPGPLEFMLRAARDPAYPYLLVLDEMNLAHVERYFADVISGMESGEPCLPNLQLEEDGCWRRVPGENAPGILEFPENLFIAGTVNVDETTYMFSPKVLDRANTLEFRVETEDLRVNLRKPGECEPGDPELVGGFLEIATDVDWHLEQPAADQDEFVDLLKRLHAALDEGFSFGHRVLFEAVRFASLYEEAGGSSVEEALDCQVMQKVLPRLHGSRRRLEPVLRSVGKFCYDLNPEAAGGTGEDGFDPVDHDPADAVLPYSFDKVRRMTRRLRTNQFVSFTE